MRESVAGLGANLVQWASHMVTPPSPSAGGDSAPRTRIDRGMLQAASDNSDDQNDIGQSVLEKPGFGARDAASITVGFIPFVGSAQSIVELVSAYDYISGEPTNRWLAAVGVVAGVVPGGKGALKAGAKATKILRKTASHADEFADAAKAATKAPRGAAAPVRRLGRAPEFPAGRLHEDVVLDRAIDYLGPGYRELSPGRYVSADGLRQFRYGAHEVRNPANHHAHFEALDQFGRVIENSVVEIFR